MFSLNKYFLILLVIIFTNSILSQKLSREFLIEDTRELSRLLESVHPDPYINCGGKIEFHRQIYKILKSIPDEGMHIENYFNLLLPFIASLQDGHTRVMLPKKVERQLGLPVKISVIDKALYVSAVYYDKDKFLLGSKIHSIEGISLVELLNRQRRLKGVENEYGNLYYLSKSLNNRSDLDHLLPECKDISNLKIEFEEPSGKIFNINVELPFELPEKTITPPTQIKLPNTNKIDIGFSFLNPNTALLLLDEMTKYRETFELFQELGYLNNDSAVFELYEKIHNKKANDVSEAINGIPSATDIFLNLIQEMKQKNTESLIIDLRKNRGGNGIISSFLLYFLFGTEKFMTSFQNSYDIVKYSKEFFQIYRDDSLSIINQGRKLPLVTGDYDFKYEDMYKFNSSNNISTILALYETDFKMMPSFYNEYKNRSNEAIYQPKKILLLTSATTNSAGYTFAVDCYKLGAKILGTPSRQSGNCYIDILQFTLPNSKINCSISLKKMIMFPEDSEKGKVLMPDHILTYEKLTALDFDPNSEVLYALEIIKN